MKHNKSEKVSIIIPIYNSENTIERCFNSVFEQDYHNVEIIAIDDGSTDSSASIIKEYLNEGRNIKYFYQNNRGAAAARNTGLSIADGEYIAFLDSDDYISKDYLSRLLDSLDDDSEMVVTGYTKVSKSDKVLSSHTINNKVLSKYTNVGTLSKLYRRDFVIESKLHFLEDAILYEDAFFCLKAFNSADKISIDKGSGYYIVENMNSVTHVQGKDISIVKDVIKTFENIKENIETKDSELMDYFLTKSAIYTILFSCKGANKKLLFKNYDLLFGWIESHTEKKNKYFSVWKDYGELSYVKMIITVFRFLQKSGLIKPFLLMYSRF